MPFLTARLSRLILLNYEVEPALLAPLLPVHTELDFHAGQAAVRKMLGKQVEHEGQAAGLAAQAAAPRHQKGILGLEVVGAEIRNDPPVFFTPGQADGRAHEFAQIGQRLEIRWLQGADKFRQSVLSLGQ